MGEAKRRKKLDPSWGKNQLIEYVKTKTQEKGRGILILFESSCEYVSKNEFLTDVIKEPPKSKADRENLENAVNFIDNYDLDQEVVSLAGARNLQATVLFCENLESFRLIGNHLYDQVTFL